MTPAASILDPNSNPALYVTAVLTLYVDLPDTPLRASVPDQRQARLWFDRGVPLPVVETALLLACLRRTARPPTCRHCRKSVPWPTSNPSLRNSWNIQLPAVISSTYASNYAVSSITPARPKFKKLRFRMIANSIIECTK
jgi:hypothetical protein